MNTIPIFDCLTHPSISGEWIKNSPAYNASLDALLPQMQKHNVKWGFAVGMKGVGNYNEEKYVSFISKNAPRLFPVAFIDVNKLSSSANVKSYLKKLKKYGYSGIKLHPRLGEFNLSGKKLPGLIKSANDLQLSVLLCTYFYSAKSGAHKNSVESMAALLEKISNEKIILLHSGSVRLMEVAEIARIFKNTLLDLSFTLVKYQGSSVDADIKYLFQNFDRRICIGSDFPEFSIGKLRERFNFFSEGIETGKLENIAFKNVMNFTGLKLI
ncbi:MAG TPA: amidohydrolase family protein [Bacteroidia bacterium]|nr:amidohydrolase family protein [Bacteroidia bacterium]